MITQESVIEILKKAEVLLEGHFLLTSGRHSDKYMQCAKLLQYPEYAEEIAKAIAQHFEGEKIDIVIAPAIGGIVIGYEVARQLKVKNMFAERVDGKMTLRRNFEIPQGAKVLVVEDVVTTGGSVKEVMEVVKAQGGEVIGVGVIVDRSNGAVDFGVPCKPALSMEVKSYEEAECPICKETDLPVVKPGSRNFSK